MGTAAENKYCGTADESTVAVRVKLSSAIPEVTFEGLMPRDNLNRSNSNSTYIWYK